MGFRVVRRRQGKGRSPGLAAIALVVVCLLGAHVPAAEIAADPGQEAPRKPVRHRSLVEEIAVVPGMVLYVPFYGLSCASGKVVAAVWEERLLDRVKTWLTTADGRAGIRPLASTHIGTGARVFYRDVSAGADVDLTLSRGHQPERRHYLLSLSGLRMPGVAGGLTLSGRIATEPSESFYGLGCRSEEQDRTRFLQQDGDVRLTHRYRFSQVLDVTSELAYRATEVRQGSHAAEISTVARYRHPDSTLAGLGGGRAHFAESAITVRSSLVDVPGSPTRGNITLARVGYSRSLDDARLSHLSLTVLTEQFRELFCRRTVSLRLGMEWRLAHGPNEIPFYGLSSLGGNLFVRGYPRGRFRDRGAAFAAATYRFPVWKRLDGWVFYETGRTVHDPDDFALKGWRDSWGGGLRVWARNSLVFEQSLAHSSEQTRLLFAFSTLF